MYSYTIYMVIVCVIYTRILDIVICNIHVHLCHISVVIYGNYIFASPWFCFYIEM